ncbi:hypothetical protein EA473_09460 [Natrarchaeobius chitinivorans]|uniref:Uncharacterized protein n=1 Tax=Natrarchaeobius chitinivorans TaxID=1679083 RepID=A0A3N6M3X1_NATCH|nr:hypothetical protein EA473_09460 [Natrarchaeobius chitinivorans]
MSEPLIDRFRPVTNGCAGSGNQIRTGPERPKSVHPFDGIDYLQSTASATSSDPIRSAMPTRVETKSGSRCNHLGPNDINH